MSGRGRKAGLVARTRAIERAPARARKASSVAVMTISGRFPRSRDMVSRTSHIQRKRTRKGAIEHICEEQVEKQSVSPAKSLVVIPGTAVGEMSMLDLK
jgi:hypothetical protein